MDKHAAKELIRETFQNPFDKDRFYHFTKELLNHFEDAHFIYRGNLIPDAYDPFIQTLERLGKYQDPDGNKIDILIVKLKKESSLEHARTMQRNFIGWYLGGSRGDVLKDAALVAFVAPDEENWRFSLVRMEYKITETPSGKVKAKEEFTPAKRYSFIVGTNETTHTAQSQLVHILEDDEHDPTLDRLAEAFNIEKVTAEFFEKYKELFLKVKETVDALVKKDKAIKKDFEAKSVNIVDFSKKLLGQIVFLYFLQKKGWFGVPRGKDWGDGDKQFLRHLFEKTQKENKNYFNKFLEPLFYEALRLERPKDYYDQFDCRIPFLNGGLFDPINDYDWQDTDIVIPNELFSNNIRDTKTGDIGTGILDIFDRYNFTVKEDEPLEKEVAVDPEMLGKVFENLLEIKDRRSTGTYYTPREIVHYMCQESLINYLLTELTSKISKEDIEALIRYGESAVEHDATYIKKKSQNKNNNGRYSKAKLPKDIEKNAELIDEKLENIRVCDPAVGSGAFPVGIMNEIIRTRNALTPYLGKDGERTPYNFKRHAIQNSLYGVDIDPGAVEIAKLRLWLSLIVDEESRETVQPLPNLDYKIMQGNSLIELLSFMPTNDHERNKIVSQLKVLKDELFNITSPGAKKKRRDKIGELIKQLFEYDRNKKIEELQDKAHSVQSQKRLFEDARDKKDEKIKIEEIENEIKEIKSLKIPGPTEHFEWRINFSEVFQEKDGFDVVIANPPYDVYQGHRRGEIEEIRKYSIYEKATGGKLNAYKLFLAKSSELQKPSGILCEIFQNSFLADNSASKIRKHFLKNQRVFRIDSFPERDNIHLRVFEHVKMSVCILISQNKLANEYQFLLRIWKDKYMNSARQINLSNHDILMVDPENATIPSIDQKEIELLKKTSKITRLKTYARCYEGEINLTFHKKFLRKEKSGYAPMIKGAAVQRWLIKEKMSQGEVEYLDRAKYLKENGGSKSQHHKLKRIVLQGITGVDEKYRLKMAIIEPGVFCGNSVNYVLVSDKTISDSYLLALLNSSLLNWFFKVFSTNSNVNGYEVDNLPIPKISPAEQKSYIEKVEKILALTIIKDYLENSTKQAEVHDLEKQIDQLVYKLYGLTPEEIKIVENQ